MLYLDCTKAITFCYKLRESVKKKLDFLKEIYFFLYLVTSTIDGRGVRWTELIQHVP